MGVWGCVMNSRSPSIVGAGALCAARFASVLTTKFFEGIASWIMGGTPRRRHGSNPWASVVSEAIGGESMSSIPSCSAALQTGGFDVRWT